MIEVNVLPTLMVLTLLRCSLEWLSIPPAVGTGFASTTTGLILVTMLARKCMTGASLSLVVPLSATISSVVDLLETREVPLVAIMLLLPKGAGRAVSPLMSDLG